MCFVCVTVCVGILMSALCVHDVLEYLSRDVMWEGGVRGL